MTIKCGRKAQANSTYGNAFLNIQADDLFVEAWGSCYKLPTYLVQKGQEFHIMVFESQAAADEILEQQYLSYEKTRIEVPYENRQKEEEN